MLPTGTRPLGHERTAVCCLSSVNFETWDEWCDDRGFVEDVLRMLDNVLAGLHRARAGQHGRRALLGDARALGRPRRDGLPLVPAAATAFPFESALARAANLRMFQHLRRAADAASRALAEERGACPDAAERGVMERFSHKLAIAPTASISVICGGTSACIEPIPANIYTHKTLSGSFSVRNPALHQGARGEGPRHRGHLAVDPRARRLGAASRRA